MFSQPKRNIGGLWGALVLMVALTIGCSPVGDTGSSPTNTPEEVMLPPPTASTANAPTSTSQPTATMVLNDALPTSQIVEGVDPAQNSPTPQVIADAARVLVRSEVSGEVIGDGTITLYAPGQVSGGNSLRVELELGLDNLYITPTPAGAVTRFPVTRITSTPRAFNTDGTPIPTPTERVVVAQERGGLFYQRMGATLTCPPESFIGCDDERSADDTQLITANTTTFTWLLNAPDELRGVQNLQIELWLTERNIDGELEYITAFSQPFAVEVVAPGGSGMSIDPRWIIIGGFLLIMLIGITVGVVLQRNNPNAIDDDAETVKLRAPVVAKPRSSKPPKPPAPTKPKVFISYRRAPSWSVARSVADRLADYGADVFLDVDDINEGRFAEVLQNAIETCDYFVPILAPETLESRWVVREIAAAMQHDKVIIPLVTNNFSFYSAELPEDIKDLSGHNAIKLLPEYFEEAVDRLAVRFMGLESKQ